MAGVLCSMVGASFVTAAAEVIRRKAGITAVGNAQVDTAQSKFGGASYLGDGVGDRLIVNGDFSQTANFTVEFWFRAADVVGNQGLVAIGNESSGRQNIYLSSSTPKLNPYGLGDTISSSSNISINTWYHLAIVRSSTTVTMYLNGSSVGSATISGTFANANGLYVGDISDGAISFNGWIDEVRVSNIARYTANFTPSTTAFTNDVNTLLLVHADGTDAVTYFEDDNGVRAPKGIATNGNAQISTAQSKFGGSSLLLDGTTDWLTIPYNPDFTFTGDFTIECWARATTLRQYNTLITSWTPGWYLAVWSSTSIQFYANNVAVVAASVSLSTNTWYHIAVSRSGTSVKVFLNGSQVGSTATLSGTITTDDPVIIGQNYNNGDQSGAQTQEWTGNIDEVRISNSARYTANFTAPTAPFQNDANTLLLIHCDGTDASTVFRDDVGIGRAARGIQAIGNAQVDTAQSQFGGTSLLLDGTGDYLNIAPFTGIAPGTGDFTFEAWIRLPNNNGDYGIFGHDGTNGDLMIRRANDGTLRLGREVIAWDLTSSVLSIANTWTHIAVCRTSTTARIFVNGTQVASGSNSQNYVLTNVFRIGSRTSAAANDFNGWIDEVRISNIGRYTANFTPSTTPFQNDANTLLLLHMDGTDASTVFVDDNGTRPT